MPKRKNAQFTRKSLPNTLDDVFAEFGVVDDATQAQGDRRHVNKFYVTLNELYPADAIIYIPPPEAIRLKLSADQQAFVFADYAVRQIAPIALEAAGFTAEATKLRKLPRIVDVDTAAGAVKAALGATDIGLAAVNAANVAGAGGAAVKAARGAAGVASAAAYAADSARDAAYSAATRCHIAADNAASAAYGAAKLNLEATWDAVTEMLYAL
jgi:hypothetical protein